MCGFMKQLVLKVPRARENGWGLGASVGVIKINSDAIVGDDD